jgi:hypothetical protein
MLVTRNAIITEIAPVAKGLSSARGSLARNMSKKLSQKQDFVA